MGKLKNIFLITFLAFFACSDSEEVDFNHCTNGCVIINKDLYNKTTTTNYSITDVALNGDLLTIKISSGGCDGNRWIVNLVDSEAIAETSIIQRYIKISLKNDEECFAMIQKQFTFNIKELKGNEPKIILNLEGWNTQINY